jgi:cellulose synthase/poly-beta-1,6-N-acetylglucosamine synthase-like glycosyltransferase
MAPELEPNVPRGRGANIENESNSPTLQHTNRAVKLSVECWYLLVGNFAALCIFALYFSMVLSPLVIVCIVFAALYLGLILYFFTGWLRLKRATGIGQLTTGKQPFVSIVIPTRNESENIKASLESIFKQNYPADLYEVIMVDDYSTDPTIRYAKEIENPNLHIFNLMQYLGDPGEYVPNKKKAIALGIKNAKGELIITTDGDCTRGENWLTTMVNTYQQGNYKLLTGPVMVKPAYWPLQVFQQIDVMNLAGITGATLRNNFPTMCNGANLMYEKKTFHEVEGFKGNHDIPTGDDIFLMQKISERYPGSVGYVKDFDACVFTRPESGLGSFIAQRKRWVSKSSRFSNVKVNLVLYFAYFFNLLIIGTAVYAGVMFFQDEFFWLPLAIAGGTKLFADLIFNIPVTIFFRKWYMLFILPFAEIMYVPYVVLIGPLSQTGRYRWKGRKVR